jgi:hypothetical protein
MAKTQYTSTKFQINPKFKISMTETLLGILPAGLWAGLDFWSLDIVCNLVLALRQAQGGEHVEP